MDTFALIPLVSHFAVVYIVHYSELDDQCQPAIANFFAKMNKIQDKSDRPLKDLIEKAGYSQASFARAMKMAKSTINDYVAGKKMPTAPVIVNMCCLLEKSPKVILKSLGLDVSGIPDDQPTDL
ncbi:MAG: helix-turn-helix transcriptional regulator [Crocosphaera sp.]|nr:helix-turn-helix transcriptional regulator [Crocosphaera sp.]